MIMEDPAPTIFEYFRHQDRVTIEMNLTGLCRCDLPGIFWVFTRELHPRSVSFACTVPESPLPSR